MSLRQLPSSAPPSPSAAPRSSQHLLPPSTQRARAHTHMHMFTSKVWSWLSTAFSYHRICSLTIECVLSYSSRGCYPPHIIHIIRTSSKRATCILAHTPFLTLLIPWPRPRPRLDRCILCGLIPRNNNPHDQKYTSTYIIYR